MKWITHRSNQNKRDMVSLEIGKTLISPTYFKIWFIIRKQSNDQAQLSGFVFKSSFQSNVNKNSGQNSGETVYHDSNIYQDNTNQHNNMNFTDIVLIPRMLIPRIYLEHIAYLRLIIGILYFVLVYIFLFFFPLVTSTLIFAAAATISPLRKL